MIRLPKQSNELPTKSEWKAAGFDVPDELCSKPAASEHKSPGFSALGEAAPVAGHTQGPWEAQAQTCGYPLITSPSGTIAKTDCSLSPGQWIKNQSQAMANARLIAMAPTLLRQVQQLTTDLEQIRQATRELVLAWANQPLNISGDNGRRLDAMRNAKNLVLKHDAAIRLSPAGGRSLRAQDYG